MALVAACAQDMRFRRILNEQTLLAILSVIISVSLWGYVTSSRMVRAPQATTKVVPVIPAIVGEPAYGYSLLGIRLTPLAVVISGPPSLIAQVETVSTEPVNIQGQTRDFVEEVSVIAPMQIRATERIRVAVQIVPAVAVNTVSGIRIQRPRPPRGFVVELRPGTVVVHVQGPVTLVNRLRSTDFSAQLEGLDFSEGRQRAQVRVQAPPQVEILSITPAVVMVTVKKGS